LAWRLQWLGKAGDKAKPNFHLLGQSLVCTAHVKSEPAIPIFWRLLHVSLHLDRDDIKMCQFIHVTCAGHRFLWGNKCWKFLIIRITKLITFQIIYENTLNPFSYTNIYTFQYVVRKSESVSGRMSGNQLMSIWKAPGQPKEEANTFQLAPVLLILLPTCLLFSLLIPAVLLPSLIKEKTLKWYSWVSGSHAFPFLPPCLPLSLQKWSWH
jgi:hypothetical protein